MLSGVVLAGGRGSRIGGDKALADVGGMPMVAHVLRALSEVADDVILSVGRGSRLASMSDLGRKVRIVEDLRPGKGPLEGLLNGFESAEHGLVAVVPCDVPFLRSDVLRLLESKAAGKDAAVPVVKGFIEPLVAVYSRKVGMACFAAELDDGLGKVGNAVSRMDAALVGEDELRAVDERLLSFWNINSREDLEKADAMARRGVIRARTVP